MNRLARPQLLLLLVPFWLAACLSPTILVSPGHNTDETGGKPLLVLSIREPAISSANRTLVPTLGSGLVTSYSAVLLKGIERITVASSTPSLSIPGLSPGAWDVTVSGYDASGNLIAEGTPATPVVLAANQVATVAVGLTLLQSGGWGTLDLTVTLPHSVGIDDVTATLAGSALNPVLNPGTTTDTVTISQPGVAAGSPLLQVFFWKNGTLLAGLTESVWIFRSITTSAVLSLGTGDFGTAPTPPDTLTAMSQEDGTILLSWNPTSSVADAYLVQRSTSASGPFAPIGTDLPFNTTTITDSGLSSATTYYYQVTAKNRFGISTSAPAAATTLAAATSPTFSAPSGSTLRETLDTLTLATTTAGASVYYTTDGTTPTPASKPYVGPLALHGLGPNLILKTVAVKPGLGYSPVSTINYTVNQRPVISSVIPTSSTGAAFHRTPSTLTIKTTATDPEGETLTFTPTFLVTGSGYFNPNWNTTTGNVNSAGASLYKLGSVPILLTIADTAGNVTTANLTITVENRAPVIQSITAASTPIYNNGTDKKIITISATDPDSGDQSVLVGTYTVSGPGQVYGNASTAYFVAGTTAGDSVVTVVISDGSMTATGSITITTLAGP